MYARAAVVRASSTARRRSVRAKEAFIAVRSDASSAAMHALSAAFFARRMSSAPAILIILRPSGRPKAQFSCSKAEPRAQAF